MVKITWNLTNGKQGHNILYATWNGTPALSVTTANTIMSTLTSGGTWTALAAFLASTTTLFRVSLLDVRDALHTEIASTNAAVPGTSASPALPSEVAAIITLVTANRGPSGRGRAYIPGWATNALGSNDVIAAAAVTALTNWASNLAGAIGTNVGAMSLGLPARAAYTSPTTGRVFPARAATTVPLTSTTVKNNTWDSQRRRGLK